MVAASLAGETSKWFLAPQNRALLKSKRRMPALLGTFQATGEGSKALPAVQAFSAILLKYFFFFIFFFPIMVLPHSPPEPEANEHERHERHSSALP